MIILGLSLVTILVFSSLRIPAVLGFFMAGTIAGPHGLAWINEVDNVETLAEIGVVLLLFTIGLELSIERLLQMRRIVLLGGSLQVALTVVATVALVSFLDIQGGEALFIGLLICLSSTTIPLKLFQEMAEVDSPHGRASLGIAIFQDVLSVPIILLTPMLAGRAQSVLSEVALLVFKGLGVLVFLAVASRLLVPYILYSVARTRSRELFSLTIVAICLAVPLLTSSIGLSLGLGAFLAGLTISESEYSHEALAGVLPLRDLFASFFFVSVGMLLDVHFLFTHLLSVTLLTLAVLLLKAILGGIAAAALGLSLRTSILVGLSLSQIGEFAFILSRIGVQNGLLAGNLYQYFLAMSVLTMAASPFLISNGHHLADGLVRLARPLLSRRRGSARSDETHPRSAIADHLVIIGFGVNGRNIAKAARKAGIDYTILEMNAVTVRDERNKGETIFYGDATHELVLDLVGIRTAKVAVVAISDPAATRRVTELVRRLNRKLHLIVRTRYIQEMKPLYELGANDVIPEEFETSIEIFARVLLKYLIPRDEIERFISEVRSDGYEMFRTWRAASTSVSDIRLHLDNIDICKLRVAPNSALAGQSLAQTELRQRHGVTVLAIRRDAQVLSNPNSDTELLAGDMLYMLGPPERLAAVAALVTSS